MENKILEKFIRDILLKNNDECQESISFTCNWQPNEPKEIIIPVASRVWKLFKFENDSVYCDKEWVSFLFEELDKVYDFINGENSGNK